MARSSWLLFKLSFGAFCYRLSVRGFYELDELNESPRCDRISYSSVIV